MSNTTPTGEYSKDEKSNGNAGTELEEHVKQEDTKRKESEFYLRRFIRAFVEFIRHRLSIIDNADPTSTVEGIERDVEFRGFNLWILIFSIFICSIGLNTNSTAVVIGAMLISPLMGPIMGVGLSIGINDFELLKRSLRNWGIAVVMAIIASTLYFFITPLSGESSELLARTTPTLLDVLVAIFGGATGILAGSRREKSNVIPGVAIATALMPPLCTAGFGLASGQWNYFFGAIYLFLINSIFISLATTLVVRYLKYPVRKLPDMARERRTKRIIGIVIFLFVLPSIYVFYNVVTRALFVQDVNSFVSAELKYEGAELVREKLITEGDENTLSVVFLGKQIPQEVINEWQAKALDQGIDNLDVFQGPSEVGSDGANTQQLADIFLSAQANMVSKDEEINRLKGMLDQIRNQGLPASLTSEIRIQYPEISEIYAGQITQSTIGNDTICSIFLKFDPERDLSTETTQEITMRISRWLETRGLSDSVWVSEVK